MTDDPYRIGRERYAMMYPENPERWNTLSDEQKQAWCWMPAEAAERERQALTMPLTEGYRVKGGVNPPTSKITVRPPAPRPIGNAHATPVTDADERS